MHKNNCDISDNSIINILTKRYDPTKKSPIIKLEENNFKLKKILNPEKKIEDLLCTSIRQKINNSKKVAIALSGGIDSALISTLIRKEYPDLKIETISVKFPNSNDETENAKKISNSLNANHHTVSIKNFLEEMPTAISLSKMPFWDIHWYYVFKKAKELSNILITGEGGDELFGGYTFRYEKFLSLVKSSASPIDKIKIYLKCHERDWVRDQKLIFGKKINFSWKKIYDDLLPFFDNKLSNLEQVFLADYNGKLLYNSVFLNLHFKNYFKMDYHAPFLNKNIISLAPHLDSNLKFNIKKKKGKVVLRNILSKYETNEFISQTKKGFSMNTVEVWNSNGAELCDYYLSDARIIEDGFINKEWIKKHFTKTKNTPNVRYVNKFLGLLAFEIWYRLFITKEMTSKTKL